jgi:SNF2 family DNA or RNA helicase
MITANTIDEHILLMAQQKKHLSECMLDEGEYAHRKKNVDGDTEVNTADLLKSVLDDFICPESQDEVRGETKSK